MTCIKELIDLKGRRALITGATGGLGRIMASTLAELGANLILTDHPESDIQSLSHNLINKWGIKVESYSCDLEIQSQRRDLIDSIKASGKGLNILINNGAFVGSADLEGWSASFEEQTIETWRRALEVNLTAIFDLCQSLTPLLRVAEGANIINISSIYGLYGPNWSLYKGTDMGNAAAYGASKGGIIQFSRWLSTTLAPNIRVNSISPGGILRNQPEVFVERYEAKTPLGRMATEDDFRGVIAYLSSDMSKYMTGQNLTVDGGWGTW